MRWRLADFQENRLSFSVVPSDITVGIAKTRAREFSGETRGSHMECMILIAEK